MSYNTDEKLHYLFLFALSLFSTDYLYLKHFLFSDLRNFEFVIFKDRIHLMRPLFLLQI